MRVVRFRPGLALILAMLLAACSGASHGPAAPSTNVNPQTGSTGSGNGK